MQAFFTSSSVIRGIVAACCVLALGAPSQARDLVVDPYHDYRDEVSRGEYQYDDSQDIPWIENETEILALPKEEDLQQVQIDTLPQGLTLLVDTRRIAVSETDRVIRLWLVVRSRSGYDNGTYEGFRCETGEYKVYAHATPRRKPPVTKVDRPRWLEARGSRVGDYRTELLQDYLCGIRGTRNADEIRQAMSGTFKRETFFTN
ncbi:MAG: hypothetical protein KDJ24_07640 [Gammaproteobacteria bacterium]|nr:hypothetical protein [Gammaproteobacteria bacterium]